MEKRRIGSLEVTVVGLGCNNFGSRVDKRETAAVIHSAIDAGINFLDTADIYGDGKSEEFIGRALENCRDEVVIATKFGSEKKRQGKGASPAYIRKAIETSLKRLKTDRIDLYQLHEPDPTVPITETLGALGDLIQAGKVREVGCSNFTVEQIREAEEASRGRGARFASVQNEYSLLDREPEQGVLEECRRLGLAFLPYFPLASGLLTGKYRLNRPPPEGSRLAAGRYADELNDRSLATVEKLIDFAEGRGHTILELAFSWLLARPAVASVIAGATKPTQAESNAQAAGWDLTHDDLAEIDGIVGS